MALAGMGCFLTFAAIVTGAEEPPGSTRAFLDGTGPGWRALGEADFVAVNGDPETWTWTEGMVHCTGRPIGVTRTRKTFTNFELMAEWRHLRPGGNSGIFVWADGASLEGLKPDMLPRGGIEVQALDHGFTEQYEKESGKKGDWFTTHGDVFKVGTSRMTPFPPLSPNGERSFPSKRLSKGVGEWNHYYVRCVNGEVRLWVNGEEVSGGDGCEPRSGYLCLESEGSPVEFRRLRIRELPDATAPKTAEANPSRFPFRKGDKVAWIGSSSTRIGTWPRTMEFLLRTRHPDLGLEFRRFTTGAGTFQTGLENLDKWLGEFHPTLVVFNYGGNDAKLGPDGLAAFRENMRRCVAKAEAQGARVVLLTPQAADVRKAGASASALRTLYAETMLAYGRARGWDVVDVHHPIEVMQKVNEKDDPAYTILKDKIHLTDPAYIGWGFLFYDRLAPPFVRSAATLTADGRVTATENCDVRDVKHEPGVLSFTRLDEALPILPPGPLPPRLTTPLEAYSRYMLTVVGLEPGDYEIRRDDRPIGVADAAALAAGVNLNSLLLDGDREAPWRALARSIWEGEELDQVGKTRWHFDVRKR